MHAEPARYAIGLWDCALRLNIHETQLDMDNTKRDRCEPRSSECISAVNTYTTKSSMADKILPVMQLLFNERTLFTVFRIPPTQLRLVDKPETYNFSGESAEKAILYDHKYHIISPGHHSRCS